MQNKILYMGRIPEQNTCNYTDEKEYLVQDNIKENSNNVNYTMVSSAESSLMCFLPKQQCKSEKQRKNRGENR